MSLKIKKLMLFQFYETFKSGFVKRYKNEFHHQATRVYKCLMDIQYTVLL